MRIAQSISLSNIQPGESYLAWPALRRRKPAVQSLDWTACFVIGVSLKAAITKQLLKSKPE